MKEWDNDNKSLFNSWSFGKINYQLFGIGLLTIILGYVLMYIGETTSFLSTKLSPFILVIGYCVIIPISILKDFNKRGGSSTG